MMAQQISLNVNNGETFKGGEKLLANDLSILGLDESIDHMKITFENDKSVSYSLCVGFIVSLASTIFWPFFLIGFPCIRWGTRKWAESRISAVTDSQLVIHQGAFGMGCCCWNESTKSVPLDKITDLQIQQGCIQKCFGIKEIRVETASATAEVPEMRLIGLHNPLETRAKILNVRDRHSQQGQYQPVGGGYNPLLPQQSSTDELKKVISSQHDTMIEIKDVLSDMRTALVQMNDKMDK